MNKDITRESIKWEFLTNEKKKDILNELSIMKGKISKEDRDYYDNITALLVDAVDKREDKERIYHNFYNKVICIATKAIKSGDFNIAYYFYKTAVLALQEKVLAPELNRELIKTLKASNI